MSASASGVASTKAADSALVERAESLHSLEAAEKAFYKAGLPFQTELRPNSYLVRRTDLRSPLPLPKPVRKHLIGVAGGMSSLTFKNWWAYVFDSTAPAVFFARRWQRQCKPPQCNAMILRANNVVYFGDRFPAASRAMAQLRQQ